MKGIRRARGLREIKTMRSIKVWSIPRVRKSNYLELYILMNEKVTLNSKSQSLDERRDAVKKGLKNIHKRDENIQKETFQKEKVGNKWANPERPLKTMTINY